jgi:hypothetical protein
VGSPRSARCHGGGRESGVAHMPLPPPVTCSCERGVLLPRYANSQRRSCPRVVVLA